jgi:hypothetical protein
MIALSVLSRWEWAGQALEPFGGRGVARDLNWDEEPPAENFLFSEEARIEEFPERPEVPDVVLGRWLTTPACYTSMTALGNCLTGAAGKVLRRL